MSDKIPTAAGYNLETAMLAARRDGVSLRRYMEGYSLIRPHIFKRNGKWCYVPIRSFGVETNSFYVNIKARDFILNLNYKL